MTIEQNIRLGYHAKHGRPMTDEDYEAFLKLATRFVVPISDYKTMWTAIDFAIGLVSDLHRQTGELAL